MRKHPLALRVAQLARAFHREFDADATKYPNTAAALAALDEAIAGELPAWHPRDKHRPRRTVEANARAVKLLRHQLAYRKKALVDARRKIRTLTRSKGEAGKNRVRPEFLVRVCMSKPLTSARAYAQAFRDLCPEGAHLSRPTISKIKDAWVEFIKDFNKEDITGVVKRAVEKATGTSGGGGHTEAATGAVVPCMALHLQDEAAQRLRSFLDPTLKQVCRSRTSKVQQHAVSLHIDGSSLPFHTEIDPLADKTAKTLATCLDSVLREMMKPVVAGIGGALVDLWFIHILVGDGINTNEAAARRLLALCGVCPPGCDKVRYFLVVIKCGSHQANLSTQCAVTGAAARVGARTAAARAAAAPGAEGLPRKPIHEEVTGVIVRLFKYLMNDYFEEFSLSTRDWVARKLRIVGPGDLDIEATRRVSNLKALYTDRVLPEKLFALWNNGVGSMQHRLDEQGARLYALDREAVFADVAFKLSHELRAHILVVDEHPTLSRFFTFRESIDKMLLMDILDVTPHCIKLQTVKPRDKNAGRLKSVQQFVKREGVGQYLRRTSLCLQLTGIPLHVTSATRKSQRSAEA